MLRTHVLPVLIWLVYRVLWLTWRIRVYEPQSMQEALKNNEPMVFAHWHGDEIAIFHLLGRYRACAMISTSKDGEIMARLARLFGARTSRGSSTRGGVSALKGILRLAKEGYRPSVAVDGPKGPYHKVKPGVFEISKLIGGKIFPLTVAVSRAYVFEKSWNKTYLPMPFAKIQIVWGEPLPAVSRDGDSRDFQFATRLEQALTNAGQEARQLVGANSNA